MTGVVFDLAEALNLAWSLLGDEAKGTLRERLTDHAFRRRVTRHVRMCLGSMTRPQRRAIAELLGDPVFADFAADPSNPARLDALQQDLIVQVLESTPDVSVSELAYLIAGAFASATQQVASPPERLLSGKVNRVEDLVVHTLKTGIELHHQVQQLDADVRSFIHQSRLVLRDLLDGEPFLAADVDLAGHFRMVSNVTKGLVPPYVPRDVDPLLDEILDGDGEHPLLLGIAGSVKSGKSRTLLEALRRSWPDTLILHARRAVGRDSLLELSTLLLESPPNTRWVLFADDVLDHLLGGANIAAVVRRLASASPPGVLAFTVSEEIYDLQLAPSVKEVSSEDVHLLMRACIRLPIEATASEQARAQLMFSTPLPLLRTEELPHFPERLAAVPQLLGQARSALVGRPVSAHRRAYLLAACQLAIARSSRTLVADDVAALTEDIYLTLKERLRTRLGIDDLRDAATWAAERVGTVWGILTPIAGSPDTLTLSDAVLHDVGEAATDPQRAAARSSTSDLAALGAYEYRHGRLARAEAWWRRAADAGCAMSMHDLGVLAHEQSDTDSATDWWRAAAAAGYTDSLVNLGALAWHEARHDDARRQWAAAAELGNGAAARMLGSVAEDSAAAMRWWQLGAALDDIPCMLHLASHTGEFGWWKAAAERGSSVAVIVLTDQIDAAKEAWIQAGFDALVAQDADHTARFSRVLASELEQLGGEAPGAAEMTLRLSERARRRGLVNVAEKLLRDAALSGSADAIARLGEGLARSGDHRRARWLYETAAEAGSTETMIRLAFLALREYLGIDPDAQLYLLGLNVSPQVRRELTVRELTVKESHLLAQAEKWSLLAVEHGNPKGYVNLSAVYSFTGRDEEAVAALKRAAVADGEAADWARVLLRGRQVDDNSG